jgi:hypothetical protein
MFTETLLRIPFSVIGRCSLVASYHWLQGKCARINLSQGASGVILQNHRQLLVSIFSISELLEGFSKLVSNFRGASKEFEFDFFIKLRNKKLL